MDEKTSKNILERQNLRHNRKILKKFNDVSIDFELEEDIIFLENLNLEELDEEPFIFANIKSHETIDFNGGKIQIIGERHLKMKDLNYKKLSENFREILIEPDIIIFEKHIYNNIIGKIIREIYGETYIEYDIRKSTNLSGITKKIKNSKSVVSDQNLIDILSNQELDISFRYFSKEYNNKLKLTRSFCSFYKGNILSQKHKEYLYNLLLMIYDIPTFNFIMNFEKQNILLYCGYSHCVNIFEYIKRYNNSIFKIKEYRNFNVMYRDTTNGENIIDFERETKNTKNIYFERELIKDLILFDFAISKRGIIYFESHQHLEDLEIIEKDSVIICSYSFFISEFDD